MKIDGMLSEKDYQKEKKRLLNEEKQIKENIGADGLTSWTKTMEETLAFVSNVTRIFQNGDPESKRLTLRIHGSNLILKDKKSVLSPKKPLSF